MKKRVKEGALLITYNLKSLVGFELIFKAASMVLFILLLWALMNLTMAVSGCSYLTAENIITYVTHPVTIPAIILIFLAAASLAVIDIGAVIFILDQSRQRHLVHFWQIMRFSLKNFLRICRKGNRPMILLVLLFIPYLGIGLASGFITTVSLPEFMFRRIRKNPLPSALIIAVIIPLALLILKWVYVFHYFTLEHCSFREARQKSSSLYKRRILKDLLIFLLMQASFYALYLLAVVITSTIIILMDGVLSQLFAEKWLVSTSIWLITVLLTAVFASLAIPAGFSFISLLFYYRKSESGEAVVSSESPGYTGNFDKIRLIHRLNTVFGVLVVSGSLILGYLLASGTLNPQIEYVRTLEITAHRGASWDYPENTMPAFEGAVELGADWIELDIQQTKDQQLVVMHDINLKRITGVNKYVWNLTYDEIKELDAGSFFRRSETDFSGTRIPLLSEVLDYAKDQNIRLNIELKPTGRETAFERSVVDMIRNYELEDRCVVTSQNYRTLQRVKKCDEEIETVYVMSMAYGRITRLTSADNFSIKSTFITNGLVSAVHNEGKQLYAWTVNTRRNIQKMIDMNVDNIITDNIVLARDIISENRTGTLLNEYVKLIQSLF